LPHTVVANETLATLDLRRNWVSWIAFQIFSFDIVFRRLLHLISLLIENIFYILFQIEMHFPIIVTAFKSPHHNKVLLGLPCPDFLKQSYPHHNKVLLGLPCPDFLKQSYPHHNEVLLGLPWPDFLKQIQSYPHKNKVLLGGCPALTS
jgi:hypothetical protein